MCPPHSDNLLVGEVPRRVCGPVLGTTRQPTGSIKPAFQPTYPPYPISQRRASEMDFDARPATAKPCQATASASSEMLAGPWFNKCIVTTYRSSIPRSCIVSSITGPSHAGLTAPAVAPHLSRRGGHIGTGNSAVTDVTDGAISRRRLPVANFTVQSPLKRNIVTFANVVLIACTVARTDFPNAQSCEVLICRVRSG
jgi:hypothetical protein